MDITSADTSTAPIATTLIDLVNPSNWLCEGTPVYNKNKQPVWVPTGNNTLQLPLATNATVYHEILKQKCLKEDQNLANNIDQTPVTLPLDGEGYLTSTCLEGNQTIGPLRDCEFSVRTKFETCTPGATVSLKCRVSSQSAGPQVIRFCEASRTMHAGTACRMMNLGDFTLANVVLTSTYQTVSFTCPKYRDPVEFGGAYATYAGPALNYIDKPASIICK